MSLDAKAAPAALRIVFPRSLLLPGYAATLFVPGFAVRLLVGAFFLFLSQPRVSKMILPHLGGSPSVWNTCMCFFQAVLLLGYAYAHWLATRFGGLAQGGIPAGGIG